MANEDILALLKYAAPVVGLLSAAWSATQKLTYEDASGAKRLTLPGRIMIGLNIAAAAISILALGFESVVRQQQADAESAQMAADKKDADEQKRLARSAAQAQLQAEALARIEADAKEQNRFLEQRFLIVSNAAAQQRRDAAVSLELARQSGQRLAEAERTLAEFERINYPLRSLEASVTLVLNFDGIPELEPLWTEIQGRDDLPSRLATRGLPDQGRVITFKPSDIRANTQNRLAYATTGTRMRLSFLPAEAVAALRGATAGADIRPVDGAASKGNGILWVNLAVESIEANTRTRTMTAYFSGTYNPETEGEAPGGEKLSLSDVARLVPILTIERAEINPAGKRPPHRVRNVGYRLNGASRFSTSPDDLFIMGESAFLLAPDTSR